MIALLRTRYGLSPILARFLRFLAMAVWMGGVLLGMSILWKYERTPTPTARALFSWPVATRLPVPSSGLLLVMVAHPCCPCTRASIDALARIMAGTPHPRAAYVLFYTPKSLPPGWKKTDLYDRAAAIPGVIALPDVEGREAARFHATVSGQTLLFDAAGRLRYDGGLTAARGVEGDSPGQEAILGLLRGQATTERTDLPVFGCSLFSR